MKLTREEKLSLLPDEFLDVALVVYNGAKKHGKDTYLDPDNPSLEPKANFKSIIGHLVEDYAGRLIDKDDNTYHLLNAATRILMKYTRRRRGIE